MKFLAPLAALLFTVTAHAQHGGSAFWLNVDYTYSEITYTAPTLTEKGNLAGIRGDLGLGLFSNLAISAGGEYADGNFNSVGTSLTGSDVTGLTKDYLRDTRALAHLLFGPLTLSGGLGQREWYNVLPGAYRQRETYNYFPLIATLNEGGLYLKAEYDLWKSGTDKSYLHDLGATHNDVTFNQTSGTGWSAELGYMIPTADHFLLRVFLKYMRWDVNDSDTQIDNATSLVAPKNNTVTMQGGIGVSF